MKDAVSYWADPATMLVDDIPGEIAFRFRKISYAVLQGRNVPVSRKS